MPADRAISPAQWLPAPVALLVLVLGWRCAGRDRPVDLAVSAAPAAPQSEAPKGSEAPADPIQPRVDSDRERAPDAPPRAEDWPSGLAPELDRALRIWVAARTEDGALRFLVREGSPVVLLRLSSADAAKDAATLEDWAGTLHAAFARLSGWLPPDTFGPEPARRIVATLDLPEGPEPGVALEPGAPVESVARWLGALLAAELDAVGTRRPADWLLAGAVRAAAHPSLAAALEDDGGDPLELLIGGAGAPEDARSDRRRSLPRSAGSFAAFCLGGDPSLREGFRALLVPARAALPVDPAARAAEVASRLGATRLEELDSAWRAARGAR